MTYQTPELLLVGAAEGIVLGTEEHKPIVDSPVNELSRDAAL